MSELLDAQTTLWQDVVAPRARAFGNTPWGWLTDIDFQMLMSHVWPER
jgi:hypothetical protein